MFDQVRVAAGIHMSTFKSKPSADGDVDDDSGDLDGSAWTPPPSFMEDMRRAEKKARGE